MTMYIGKVAELTGATRKAIRLYEAMGLIPAAGRQGNYRVYSEKDVLLISMIRRAQSVGFNLTELKPLVALKVKSTRFPLELALELIGTKRQSLHNEMNQLVALEQRLNALEEELKRNFCEITVT
ncbi:MAG TPA: MerR family transcriptional regulator [Gammaproteobacteria bacterium]